MSTPSPSGFLGYLVLVAAIAGCDGAPGGDLDGATVPDAGPGPQSMDGDCIPDEPAWQSTIRPLVAQHCGSCHGETPQFGAPYALTDYALLIRGTVGERPVDHIALRVGDGTMPPPAQPQPGGADRAAIVDWARCGAGGDPGEGPNPGGFDVDRPLLDAPETPPAGTDFFELRADGFEVAADMVDRIECFTFAAPVDGPRMIRRIETIVDDSRVLHHATLIPGGDVRPAGTHSECTDDMGLNVLYAWAPGQGPLHFAEGGIIVEPGQILTVQIHYNNAAEHADVRDRSGVRIHHGPVEGPVVDQATFGPFDFEIPPRSTHTVTGRCVIPQETTLVASFPHMHDFGASFRQTVTRSNGTVEPIITLEGWSFDDQYIYETPMVLEPGDVVETTCRFENPNDFAVSSGTRSQDEMCFNFAYVTPPLPGRYCDTFGGGDDDDGGYMPAMYAPSACAPDDASADGVERVEAEIVEGMAEPAMGGALAPGRYVVNGARGHFARLDIGFGPLDMRRSEIDVAGQAWIGDDRIALDLLLDLEIVGDRGTVEEVVELGLGGPPIADGPTALAFEAQCTTDAPDGIPLDILTPGDVALDYDATLDGRLRIVVPLIDGVTLALALRPAP